MNGLDTGTATDRLILASGQTLKGVGTVTGTTNAASGSTIAPGASPGILEHRQRDLQQRANFDVEINGTTVGSGYDQLNATGTVALGGATLNLSGTHTPVSGNSFTIVQTTGGVSGTFNGLSDGDAAFLNGKPLEVDYQANSVVLTFDATPVISGTAGADNFTVVRSGSNLQVKLGLTTIMDMAFSDLTSLTINGLAGSDTLTVDFSQGDPIPSGGISYAGGESSGDDDRLILTGGSTVATVNVTHTGSEAGNVVLSGLGTVTFSEIEPSFVDVPMTDLGRCSPLGLNADATLGDDGVCRSTAPTMRASRRSTTARRRTPSSTPSSPIRRTR